MSTQITAKSFDYQRFNARLEEQDRFISDWITGEHDHEVPLWIIPPVDMWTYDTCRRREEFLHKNLELLHTSMEWRSDLVFPHLQPWYPRPQAGGVFVHRPLTRLPDRSPGATMLLDDARRMCSRTRTDDGR